MNRWAQKQKGFTIVELLIVVVVIAILAAITVVAYTGIQNRTNDSVVQSDLRSSYQKIEQYRIDNNEATPEISALSTVGITATKSAYSAPLYGDSSWANNFIYCRPSSNTSTALLAARSKSGKVFRVSSAGLSEFTGDLTTSTSGQTTCSRLGLPVSSNTETDRTVLFNSTWVSWIR